MVATDARDVQIVNSRAPQVMLLIGSWLRGCTHRSNGKADHVSFKDRACITGHLRRNGCHHTKAVCV